MEQPSQTTMRQPLKKMQKPCTDIKVTGSVTGELYLLAEDGTLVPSSLDYDGDNESEDRAFNFDADPATSHGKAALRDPFFTPRGCAGAPGTCYRELFDCVARPAVVEALGINPLFTDLRGLISSGPIPMSISNFGLALHIPDSSSLRKHAQAHVFPSPNGLPAADILSILDQFARHKETRVGGFSVKELPSGDAAIHVFPHEASVPRATAEPPRRVEYPGPRSGDVPDWPDEIPTPQEKQRAKWTGLQRWLHSCRAVLENYFRVFVLGVKKPTDEMFLQELYCQDVYAVYALGTVFEQRDFDHYVECVSPRDPDRKENKHPIVWPEESMPLSPLLNEGQFKGLQKWIEKEVGNFTQDFFWFHVLEDGPFPEHTEYTRVLNLWAMFEVYCRGLYYDQMKFREQVRCLTPVPPPPPPPAPVPPGDPPKPVPPPQPVPPPPNHDGGPVEGGPARLPETGTTPMPGTVDPDWHPLPRLPPKMPVDSLPKGQKLQTRLGANSPQFWDAFAAAGVTHPNVDQPGYCYLALFIPTARAEVARQLGCNPWATAVAAKLQEQPGSWSGSRFNLLQGAPCMTTQGPAFVQSHVTESSDGIRVRDVLLLLSPTTRVGMATADLNALMSLQQESQAVSTRSVFDIAPSATGTRLTIGLCARVGNGFPDFTWNVFSTPALILMLGIYESVRLESIGFDFTVSEGSENAFWAAVAADGIALVGTQAWMAAPVTTTIYGSSSGAVKGRFELPANNQFAKELRTRTMGNTGPTFHFSHQGKAGSVTRLTGSMVVTVSGQAVIGHVDIGGQSGGKHFIQPALDHVASVKQTLGYSTTFKSSTLDIEDRVPRPAARQAPTPADDGDDDDERPAATVANNSKARSPTK